MISRSQLGAIEAGDDERNPVGSVRSGSMESAWREESPNSQGRISALWIERHEPSVAMEGVRNGPWSEGFAGID